MISLDYGGWNIQIDNRYSFQEYFSDFCSTLTEQHSFNSITGGEQNSKAFIQFARCSDQCARLEILLRAEKIISFCRLCTLYTIISLGSNITTL